MYRQSTSNPPCPRCGAMLYRVRRKPWDRLVSLVSPRRRYRCMHPGCAWAGTLADSQRQPPAGATEAASPK